MQWMAPSAEARQPPRWLTPEFVWHYAVITRALVFLYTTARHATQQLSPAGRPSLLRGVQPGVWPQSQVDLSDPQWRSFRHALPALCMAALLSAVAARLLAAVRPASSLAFDVLIGVVFTAHLYGGKAVLTFVIAAFMYLVSNALAGTRGGAPALWCVNCAILLAVQVNGKLPLSHLIPMLAPLDGWKGAARWDTSYNMMMLRLLSYGLDLHWCRRAATAASTPGGATPGDKATPLPRDEQRQLASSVLLESHYSGSPFLAYILFPPLQIAGPIIPFNAFAAQQLRRRGLGAASTSPPMPAKVVAESSFAGVARYALRFAIVWACLEWQTHAIHANAMATSSAAWRSSGLLAPAQAACVSFLALMFTWLKFTCMWRFFRLWSLAWGCVPPENMLRCVCNNYDAEGFWRGWHASFNRWLVRYLYIPLGGSSARKPLNLWLVFTFVALWHDLVEPRLLGWAWLTCLFLLPELGVKLAARLPWVASRAHTAAYRHACAALASLNITCLMAANLVGFVIGLSGARLWLSSMLTRDGIRVLASSLLTFFSAAHIMFEVRAKESRRALT